MPYITAVVGAKLPADPSNGALCDRILNAARRVGARDASTIEDVKTSITEAVNNIARRRANRSAPEQAAPAKNGKDEEEEAVPVERAPRRAAQNDERGYGPDRRTKTYSGARHDPGRQPRPARRTFRAALDEARAMRDEIAYGYHEDGKAAKRYGDEIYLPAAVVGAFNTETGDVVVGESQGGRVCAEDDAVSQLGCADRLVFFTGAVRPRHYGDVPVCPKCQGRYYDDQFERGTNFD
jgi:hypothetical protein